VTSARLSKNGQVVGGILTNGGFPSFNNNVVEIQGCPGILTQFSLFPVPQLAQSVDGVIALLEDSLFVPEIRLPYYLRALHLYGQHRYVVAALMLSQMQWD